VVQETVPVTAEAVTEEMVQLTLDIVDGWYPEGRIDWEDVWDRLDFTELKDGTRLELGVELLSPALKKIKSEVKKIRSSG
jgi:hypothetical protein